MTELQLDQQSNSLDEKFRYVYAKDSGDGTPERTLFQDRLHQAIAFARRYKFKVGVLSIDLDTFKNDDPSASDVDEEIIQDVARRIVSALRETDTISSQGVDELVVILPDLKEDKDANTVAYKIIDLLSQPFTANGKEVSFEPFIGISIYPDDTENPQELIIRANVAVSQGETEGEVVSRIKTLEIQSEKVV